MSANAALALVYLGGGGLLALVVGVAAWLTRRNVRLSAGGGV